MTGFVLRRSALAFALLVALLAAAGGVLVVLGVPAWVPFVISILLVLAQYALAPYVIQAWRQPWAAAPCGSRSR